MKSIKQLSHPIGIPDRLARSPNFEPCYCFEDREEVVDGTAVFKIGASCLASATNAFISGVNGLR